jgi:hypothetical protein
MHYQMLANMRQGVLNMFAAGLHHAFEQQLLEFYRREVLERGARNASEFTIRKVRAALRGYGIDLEALPSWPVTIVASLE